MNTFSLILQQQSDISDAKILMLKVSPASRDYREHFISRKWKRHILHEFNILIWPRKINEDRPLILHSSIYDRMSTKRKYEASISE